MTTPPAAPAYRIARAGAGDVPLVAPLFDAYRVFYGKPSDPGAALHFIGQRVLSDESVVLVALSGFGPHARGIGFVQLYPSWSSVWLQRVWILNDLFVEPSVRRVGVARALLRQAAGFAKGDGARRLVLSTACDNEPAKSLYRSMGWVTDDRFEHWKLDLV